MKILFDNEIFAIQKYGGISRYFAEIIKHLKNDSSLQIKIPILCSPNQYLREIKSLFIPYKNQHSTIFAKINLATNVLALKSNNFDLAHFTYFNKLFLPHIKDKPCVITIHDMSPELHGSSDENKKVLAHHAHKIIAVSQNTKNDILKFYDIPQDKIEVIHHGSSFDNSTLKTIKPCTKLFKNYFLYVGYRGGIKNFTRFIMGTAPILKNNKWLGVVCAGSWNFTKKEKQLFKELEITKQIIQIPVTDCELKFLYKNALAFIFPSLYEGFGIPVLEAFSCKCPTLLHYGSSFPEIAGDAALYFDGTNINSISNSLEKIITDKNLRESLIKKGNKQNQNFSWKKAAEQTKLVYKSIL
jgi:glycosyltransferase involved in cell wall biosynthesis